MSARKTVVSLLFVALCASNIFGQQAGRDLFLRHSLIFLPGETPHASLNSITFTKSSVCGFSEFVYNGKIIQRGKQVKITSVNRAANPAEVNFTYNSAEYSVKVANASNRIFEQAFRVVFSDKKTIFDLGEARSSSGMIKRFGFPIARCDKDDGWLYILEFSPHACGSYDGCVIRLTKKGMDISGYN